MKKLASTVIKKLPPLKLYLDDLERIVELMNSIDCKITILTDEYELENLAELGQLKKKVLHELQINATTPNFHSIALSLTQNSADLSIGGTDKAEMRGVFEQLLSYLQGRKTHLMTLLKTIISCLVPFGIVFIAFLTHNSKLAFVPPLALIILTGIVTPIWALYSFVGNNYYSTIFLSLKSDAPSYWERNKEKIWLVIITAVISFLFGWLARFLPGPK
jgi:hypothetical protein